MDTPLRWRDRPITTNEVRLGWRVLTYAKRLPLDDGRQAISPVEPELADWDASGGASSDRLGVLGCDTVLIGVAGALSS